MKLIRSLPAKNHTLSEFLSLKIEKELGIKPIMDYTASHDECAICEMSGGKTVYVLSMDGVSSMDPLKYHTP